MSRTGLVIRIILLMSALWAGGFLAFVARVSTPSPPPPPADGISVLTGSAGRIVAGLELLKQRPSTRMLITGVGDGTAADELASAFPKAGTLFDCCIELDHHAKDTVGNALQTSLWVRRNNFDSVVIVTSASHMPRSLVEMRRQMKTTQLHALSTGAGADAPGNWLWRWSSLRRLGVEYHKYLVSLVRARLFDDIGDMSKR